MKFHYLLLCAAFLALADDVYRKPPKDVLDVLNAPATPRASVSPAHTYVLLTEPLRYPPIADLAQPMLRLAGLRINPATNGPHRALVNTSIVLKRIADGTETRLRTPAGAKLSQPKWSPDGQSFAFTATTGNAIELWVGDAATGQVHRVEGLRVNAVGAPTTPFAQTDHVFQWMPDNRTLLVQAVPANRGPAPADPSVPLGPHVQESFGRPGPIRTYEDMLANAHDEDLFDYYGTSQITVLDIRSQVLRPVGTPGVYSGSSMSPDGKYLLVTSDVYPECGADDSCNAKRLEADKNSKVQARLITTLLYRHWTTWEGARRSHLLVLPVTGGVAKDLTPGDRDVPAGLPATECWPGAASAGAAVTASRAAQAARAARSGRAA